MNRQLSMFNRLETQYGADIVPASRESDPETSKAAAEKHRSRAGSHRAIVAEALRKCDGQTGHELARATGLDQVEVIRRLNDLERLEVVRSAETAIPCTAKPKSKQNRWWLR